MKLSHFSFLFFLVTFTLSAESISRTKVLMGTFVTVTLQKEDKKHFPFIFSLLKNIDSSLSSYDINATIYRLNHSKRVKADFYSFDALSLAKEYYRITDGYFNVAIGSITKDAYRFGKDEQVPKREKLLQSDISFSKLYFDEYYLRREQGIKVDLGGMGKGYAVDKVVEYLKRSNIKKATVALSGDIFCLGICSIKVQNPKGSQRALAQFFVKNKALSTSGNYNRYVESPKHNHLINPKSKSSAKEFISITLISELANSDLDAFATAASVMPKEKAYKFLNSLPVAYIIVEKDSSVIMSDKLLSFIEDTHK